MGTFNDTPPFKASFTPSQMGPSKGEPTGGEGHPEGISHYKGALGQELGVNSNIAGSLDSINGTSFSRITTLGLLEAAAFPSIDKTSIAASFTVSSPLATAKTPTLFSPGKNKGR